MLSMRLNEMLLNFCGHEIRALLVYSTKGESFLRMSTILKRWGVF